MADISKITLPNGNEYNIKAKSIDENANLKTVNGNSLIGNGNISIGAKIYQYDTLPITQNIYLGATNPTSVTGLVAGDIYIYVPTSN